MRACPLKTICPADTVSAVDILSAVEMSRDPSWTASAYFVHSTDARNISINLACEHVMWSNYIYTKYVPRVCVTDHLSLCHFVLFEIRIHAVQCITQGHNGNEFRNIISIILNRNLIRRRLNYSILEYTIIIVKISTPKAVKHYSDLLEMFITWYRT